MVQTHDAQRRWELRDSNAVSDDDAAQIERLKAFLRTADKEPVGGDNDSVGLATDRSQGVVRGFDRAARAYHVIDYDRPSAGHAGNW